MDQLLAKLDSGPDADKGDSGRLGIVGGSIEFAGPPALAGLASLRTGTDVTKVLTSEAAIEVVAGFSPNVLTNRFTGDVLTADSVSKVLTLAEWSDALVVGPGLESPHPDAIREIVDQTDVPTVVDATAIEQALGADFDGTVLTPDSAEVDRIEDEHGSLDEFVQSTGAVVVSKGAEDVIYDGEDRFVNDEGTPAMTVAGTGDTLAGVVGSLLGQGLGLVEAARLAPWIVGRAGELAADEYGTGIVATDLIERIPAAVDSGR
ncbi:NAD(P)H-hydrate dehydratase [Halosimplex sp. J119]